MAQYNMRGIPHHMVERMWSFAEPYVKRALDHSAGELDTRDLLQACADRDVQLWLVSTGPRIVGAVTTEIVQYPKKKHLRVITIAGSAFPEWVGMVDTVLGVWAKSLECDAMEAHVRKGFVQKLAPLGYKHLHSVVVKKLDIMPAVNGSEVHDG